jgi:RimJ/RimL family protein N-acetyltransferase
MDAGVWPLFALRVVTPSIELRYPDDRDLIALAKVAASGIHGPGEMPFGVPWTDAEPDALQRGLLQFHWRNRGALAPTSWWIELVAVVDDRVVGVQGMFADHFPTLRSITTGSWLGQAHQGRGIGTEMRHAILHLAFAGLGAHEALSGAWHDNVASLTVTSRVGYSPNGERLALRRGTPDRMTMHRLDREGWLGRRRDDIEIHGLGPCLPLLGLAPEG